MAITFFNNNGNTVLARSPISLESDQKNPVNVTKGGAYEQARIMWDFFFNKPEDTRPAGKIPVQTLTKQQLQAAPNNTVYRLGHSTVLLKMHDSFWITDPMFSDRASPVTPLGVGDIIVGWGVPSSKVKQLDWWQETEVDGVRFAATPARQFSGRGLFGTNQTQWASWVFLAEDQRVFFSGDSGYFDGFKKIGTKYGSFDLTLLETGAYNENWPEVHMSPEETIQAYLDLRGKRLLPIHNGTFDLAMHSWRDPFDRAVALGNAQHIPVLTPEMGKPVSIQITESGLQWWVNVDREKVTERVQFKGQPATGQL